MCYFWALISTFYFFCSKSFPLENKKIFDILFEEEKRKEKKTTQHNTKTYELFGFMQGDITRRNGINKLQEEEGETQEEKQQALVRHE
jgi:hypothetical protein